MPGASSPQRIAGPWHARVEETRRLQRREGRERSGLYYGEGLRFVATAVEQRAQINTLVVCPPLLHHPFAPRLTERLRQHQTPILLVNAAALYQSRLIMPLFLLAGE
jgi:RNA methyltransferase, TrmH family